MVEADIIELKGYNWKEAREAIKAASYLKEEIEVPAIKGCFNWTGLNCLELSRNDDARLALALKDYVKHTTILVPYPQLIAEIEKNVKSSGVEYGSEGKIDARFLNLKEELPNDIINNNFDVVYLEWVSHSWLENERLLEQLLKITNKYFLVIMPNPESDDTLIASIKNQQEKDRRIRVRDNLQLFLEKMNWRVSYMQKNLPLRFKSEEDAKKTFYCMAFDNKATEEQKIRLDAFLGNNKFENIDDSFYIICAEKI